MLGSHHTKFFFLVTDNICKMHWGKFGIVARPQLTNFRPFVYINNIVLDATLGQIKWLRTECGLPQKMKLIKQLKI